MAKENTDNNEELIRGKIAAGLSRDQAVAVIKAQEEHDAALEKAARKTAKSAE